MIIKCKSCEANNRTHEFQDERYGKFVRVFTPRLSKNKDDRPGRCTICSETQDCKGAT